MLSASEYPGSDMQFQENGKEGIKDHLEPATSDYRVLVVQHHQGALRMMASMFRKLGCQAAVAFDSTKAFLYFTRVPCDLLFTDFEMPVLNGYHLARLIKKHHPQAKAVAMTCRCQAEVADYMEDGTIDGWLFKPFKTKEMLETLARIGLPVAIDHCQVKG